MISYIKSYMKKASYVEAINNAIKPFHDNIDKIRYHAFKKVEEDENYVKEFVTITYQGGAQTILNVNCDSCSAIFQEIGKYIDSGWYHEGIKRSFEDCCQSVDWARIV